MWQIHQSIYRECYYDSKTIMSPSGIDLAKRCCLQMPSLTMHWPGINSDIKCLIELCPTCQHHCPQEPQSYSSQHWPQNAHGNLSTLTASTLMDLIPIVADYFSKMPIIRRNPASHCNASRTISVLEEIFAEHGIPEVLCTDKGPQFANAFFT